MVVSCGGGGGAGSALDDTGGQATRLAAAKASEGGVMINELHAAAWHGVLDEDGESNDWVELYNPASAEVDLSGYGLSNKSASPFLWTFPAGTKVSAHGYLTVWLSKKDRVVPGAPLHANFNLDNGADTLNLSASNATAAGILVDSVTPPLVKPDHGWCRMPSGVAGAPFQICLTATPGAANSGPSFPAMLATPVMSLPSGLYSTERTVSISGPPGSVIRYTTDGSEPTTDSALYTAPLTVSVTTVLRAAAFADGYVSSKVQTQTYAINATRAATYANLKVVFVTLNDADRTRFQAHDKTLETVVPIEMFNAGTQVFKIEAEGSVAGQLGGAGSPQMSMNVTARDAFGVKSFPAALWPEKPGITGTKKLRLRNASDDWDRAHLRDQFAQSLGAAGPNPYGSSSTVAMFINGHYYGMMDLREREDETLIADNLKVDKDYVDFLADPLLAEQEIKNGGAAALARYQAMHNYVTGNDMSVASNFAQAQTLLDTHSLAWDWAMHMLQGNTDWPDRNVHVFRSPEFDGRWTWQSHDNDYTFGRFSGADVTWMNYAFEPTRAGSKLFLALLRNDGFRNDFLNTVADQMNLMTPAMMNDRLDTMVAEMRPYVADFYTQNQMGSTATWEGYVGGLRDFIRIREGYFEEHLRVQFDVGSRGAVGVTLNDAAGGTVLVNGLDVGAQMRSGVPAWSGKYFPGVPITLTARPRPGYVFAGWQGSSTATSATISHTVAASPTLNGSEFSARWTGQVQPAVSGSYRFQTISDDGVRVKVNGQTLIDNWAAHTDTTDTSAEITLVAGQRYDISIDYYDGGGAATMRLLWLVPGKNAYVPIPASYLYADAATALPTGLAGSYFNNLTMSGEPVARAIEAVDFRWVLTTPTPSAAQFRAVFQPAATPAAPAIAAIEAQQWRTGDIVDLRVAATDPAGYPLSYSATKLPKGLNLHPSGGKIYGRITTPGSYSSVITVSNGLKSSTLSVNWTVLDRPGTGLLGTSVDSGIYAYNVRPTVTLTTPAQPTAVAAGSALTLAATASDSDGTVARVDFYDGASLVGTATAAPWTASWTASLGVHPIVAKATDNLGGTTVTAAIPVTVLEQAPTTLPAGAVSCAAENETCALPAGITATVYFGANGQFVGRQGMTGNVSCSNDTFGDPLYSVSKSCSYVVTAASGSGSLKAEFWNNTGFTGSPVLTRYELPAMNLPEGVGPGAGLPTSQFGARWSGSLTPATSGTYTFRTDTSSADGVRLWVNEVLLIDNWVSPVSSREASVALTAGRAVSIRVEFFDAAAEAVMSLRWKTPGSSSFEVLPAALLSPMALPPAGALKAEYWANTAFSGLPALTREELPAMNLGDGVSPAAGLPTSLFAVRWSGTLTPPATGSYVLHTDSSSADGVRLWVDDVLVIDNWSQPATSREATVTLSAGRATAIRVEFFDAGAEAQFKLTWKPPGGNSLVEPPSAVFSPSAPPTAGALKAEYWTNPNFTGVPLITREELPAMSLGDGVAPGAGLPTSLFGVRWSGSLLPATSGVYVLRTRSSTGDGVRMWVDGQLLIDNWTLPATTRQASISLTAGRAVSIRIEFFDAGAEAVFDLAWKTPGAADFLSLPAAVLKPQAPAAAGALKAEYWGNTAFTGDPVLTREELPAMTLAEGLAPGTGLPTSLFAVRWSGTLTPTVSGLHALRTVTSPGDGVRLWVNGQLLIDNWSSPVTSRDGSITLTAGQPVAIRVEFFDAGAEAIIGIGWKPPGALGFGDLPAAQLRPTAP